MPDRHHLHLLLPLVPSSLPHTWAPSTKADSVRAAATSHYQRRPHPREPAIEQSELFGVQTSVCSFHQFSRLQTFRVDKPRKRSVVQRSASRHIRLLRIGTKQTQELQGLSLKSQFCRLGGNFCLRPRTQYSCTQSKHLRRKTQRPQRPKSPSPSLRLSNKY